jgi:alpha-L-fucosidase
MFTRKKPSNFNIIATLICVLGVWVVSYDKGGSSTSFTFKGEGLTLISTIFFAIQMALTGVWSKKLKTRLFTMSQMMTAGIICLVAMFITKQTPTTIPSPKTIWYLVYLLFLATVVCFLFNNWGLKRTSAISASLILSLESVFGLIFAAMFLHERFGANTIVGFIVILIAVIISETELKFIQTAFFYLKDKWDQNNQAKLKLLALNALEDADIVESKEFLDNITSIAPTERQIEFQNLGYYNFIHFGLNTFTKKEWGSGDVSPQVFTLKNIDTDSWVSDLQKTGSKGIIITAKHHDGFCLFNSEYTDYTIKNTVYKDGKGDVIEDLQASCEKYGMKLGIYLSPWDRHEKTYGTKEYNDFFCNQLEELCTGYGDIFCFWFDGACGEGANGKKQEYDWERYYALIRALQPNAAIVNCGPDARWIGNEGGVARRAEYAVVPKELQSYLSIAQASQQDEKEEMSGLNNLNCVAKGRKQITKDDKLHSLFNPTNSSKILGERFQLAGKELVWWPSEMDISVTKRGWFWKPLWEKFYLRSAENIASCYFTSVGNNATLLLNVPPNDKGVLPKAYIARIHEAKEIIEEKLSNVIDATYTITDDNVIKITMDSSTVNAITLAEDVRFSQRVESFKVFHAGKEVYSGKTIGFNKICILPRPIQNCAELEIKIEKARAPLKLFKVIVS